MRWMYWNCANLSNIQMIYPGFQVVWDALVRTQNHNCHSHGTTRIQGPVSISEKTSFRKISSSLEAARLVFRIVRSLWNLTGTSAALLPMCLSNFKAIRRFKVQISWLRVFTRSYEKTSFRILRRGPEHRKPWVWLELVGIRTVRVNLTHLPLDKMVDVSQTTF